MGLFTATIIYFNCEITQWRVEQGWVINASTSPSCDIGRGLDFRIGIDYTFIDTSVIFSIIGAGFGVSFATTTVEDLMWSET